MEKAVAARQAVSFVLGAVAGITVVMLVQYREPAAGPRSPWLFSGWRSFDHRRLNGTSELTVHRAPILPAGEDHHDQANATLKANSSATTHTAAVQSDQLPSTDRQEEDDQEFRGLAAAVADAAMDDRTVIITCVNQAWAAPGSLLDLFLESFRIGNGTARLLQHLLLISMDPAAHARCLAVHWHCYHYTMPGVHIDFTSDKWIGSPDWLDLVWSKLKLQRQILELGYGFLFTDVDVMWLRDPFKHVTAYADMTISSDNYFGDPDNLDNFPNTGFFHVKPNKRTVAMTKLWHDSRGKYLDAPNEQPVFNKIKKGLVVELGLRLQYLDPAFIGGFCSYGKDLGKIVTMHSNCCIGLDKKMKDLRSVLDDWKNYTKMPPSEMHQAKWTVPGACIR